ncbi:MAG: HesA/MoeB/ThiF family protein [Desulfobacterales bacterium]|nr:HesA/MoeB/ThiF family protein [Desulfobacterales bacterium]
MSEKLMPSIKAASRKLKRPDGDDYLSLAVKDTDKIAVEAGVPGKEVEIAALENGIVPERYARNMKTLSTGDQLKLLEATVSIVGLGGLGGTVTEMLARLGVGRLKLIDGDVFEDSNLNRQVTSRMANMGMSKADAARERVLEINSGITVEACRSFLEEENGPELIRGSDVVVDCLDSLKSRYYLAVACREIAAPLVVAAVAGLAGQVTVFFPEDDGIETVFGAPGEVPEKGVETLLGNLAPIVGMIANIECAEVVKILLGRGRPLRNRMLLVDLMDSTFETVDLS